MSSTDNASTRTGLTRRDFLGATASALIVLPDDAAPGAIAARPAAPPKPALTQPSAPAPPSSSAPQAVAHAYVGTFTPNGGGIYLFRLDLSSGALTQLQVFDGVRNPSWLALNPAQTRLYAISEIDNYLGSRDGAVACYAIDADSLHLRQLRTVSSRGSTPTHLSVHPSGKFVFVANYGGGSVAVFPIGEDGTLSEASDVRPSIGPRHRSHATDDPPGQFALSNHDGPHIHMVASDPTGQFVIANDAGLDLTLVWRLDAQAGRLLPADTPVIIAPPGSAPRHFVFHPNGRVFYNVYEHDSKVAVYDYDSARGALRHRQSISALPAKFAGSNLASEILITADGRFLYVANRLHNAVAIFGVAADGQLRMIAETWAHADSPRSLAIDPSGQYLFACNQRADSITSFRIASATGALQFTGRFEPVGSPAAMTFLSARQAQKV
jgi:6-phosphogluconolactonase